MIEYQRVISQINLDNIAYNVRQISSHINKETKIMAVVKADGYGHGAVEVAKTCLYNGATWLGVAICDEGIQLRKNNIFEPILILGYTVYSKLEDVINYNLTQTVFSYEMALELSKVAQNLKKSVDVHIKVDTGMGRLGFLPNEQSLKDIILIKNLPFINITGIFTHFATADEEDKTFTKQQFNIFSDFVQNLENNGIKNLIKHVSNSAATLDLKNFNLDMVRAGIIIYGLYPSNEIKNKIHILPAMEIKTHISYIKELEKEESIGYGRTYYTTKKTKVATVPIGYADGYSRSMSNKAKVIVNGEFANVIGSVCMDQMMIDITHIKNVNVNDEVTILGTQKNSSITAQDLAKIQGTINYEIICSISKRIPRVYIKNGEVIKTVCY